MILKSTRDYIKNLVRDEVNKRLPEPKTTTVLELVNRVSAVEDELRHRKQLHERKELKEAPFPERANDNWTALRLTRDLKPSSQRRVIMLPVQVNSVRKQGPITRHDMAFITASWPGSPDAKVTIFHGNKNRDIGLQELANLYDYYYLAVAE